MARAFRFVVGKVGIDNYKRHLGGKICAIMNKTAQEFYEFQVPKSKKFKKDDIVHPRWSGYFRANWMVAIDSRSSGSPVEGIKRPNYETAKRSVLIQAKYMTAINAHRAEEFFKQNRVYSWRSKVSVYNPTPYGKWLNDGGTFAGRERFIASNFMQLGINHVKENMPNIIKQALLEYRNKS